MIRASSADGVARIEIDRPEKKNAFTGEMYLALGDALLAADRDREVKAVLLHGSRDCFTAGNDLADFLEPREQGVEAPVWRVFRALPGMQKPVVAAVAGPAVGIGATLLLHCDLVFAAPSARFQFPFVRLGIVPEFASTLLLPMLAGHQRAAQLLLLGQPFGAEQAREAGMVNAVVPDNELLERAESAARALAALPAESIRLTRQLMKSAHAEAIEERIAQEARIFTERLASADARQAIGAFLAKRKP